MRFDSVTPERAGAWSFRWATLPILAFSGACAGGEPPPSDPFSTEAWTLGTPEVRIGSVDDPDYTFSHVQDLTVAPDGTVFSLHPEEVTVRRWTADGRPMGTIGRAGEGPGEFDRPSSLGFFGDTLWVMDAGAYRVSFFGMEGTLLGNMAARVDLSIDPESPEEWPPRPTLPFRDGSFYGIVPALSSAIADGRLSVTPHVHMNSDGTMLDTLWRQDWRTKDGLALLTASGGGVFGSQPYGDRPLHVLDPSGLLLVLDRRPDDDTGPAAFRVTSLTQTADTVFSIDIPYAPVPLPASRADSALAAQVDRWATESLLGLLGVSRAGLAERLRDAMYVPEHVPPVSEMVLGAGGAVWIRRFDPVEGAAEWLVLDGSGSPWGRVRTPSDFRILEVTDSAVWGVETDDLEVEYIVRRPILRDSAAEG